MNDDGIAYEPSSIRYRKFLWWNIPIEKVIEHPAVAKFKQERRDAVLEKDIEAKVCAFAKSHGMLVYKFTSPQRRSVPDRLFITRIGVVFFIEFKKKGKKPTEGQAREIARLRATGVQVFIVDEVDEGKRIVGLMAIGAPDAISIRPV